jgi:hypothetical protein
LYFCRHCGVRVLKRAVGVKLSFLDGTFLVETGKVGRVISALPL